MEFKEFLEKHGVLQEFCNELRRQINNQQEIQCNPPALSDTASIMGLHWRFTTKGREFWRPLYRLEGIEVTKYDYEVSHYYKLDEKIPKCLKRL